MDRESFAAAHRPVPSLEIPASQFATRRDKLPYPVPAQRSFFLPPADASRSPREQWCEELLDALALGVGDYFEKTGAFRSFGVAVSGGRDSMLTLLIAHRYVKKCARKTPAR